MKVLIACEFSATIREEFSKMGHDAWSCDIIDTEIKGNHIIGDAIEVAYNNRWDLMICHPPCTYLSVSGARWFKDRIDLQKDAIKFAVDLYNAPIEKVAMENPISVLSSKFRKPDQIIQPWQFGHGETKSTCLWLKGLSNLKPTNIVNERENRIHRMGPSKNRSKERSRTYKGIAQAMAEQWGS